MTDEMEKEVRVTSLNKDITLEIVNEFDKSATRIEIWRISEEDKAVWARLYDAEGNLITGKRVYSYEGEYKDIPCELTDTDIVLIKADLAISKAQEIIDSIEA